MSKFVLRKLVVDEACGKKLKILEPGEYVFSDSKYDSFFEDGISIQAVVGKNGCGKSSLVEMLFRMSNNLAALMLRGYNRPAADTIFFIRDVVAELHYDVDNWNGVLKCEENSVELIVGCECFYWSTQSEKCMHFIDERAVTNEFRHETEMKAAAAFFYTIATNYSVQSYIAGNFASESLLEWKYDENLKTTGWFHAEPGNSWINSVFHKNDGYMSPIVLNPYRHNGKIDMEQEERLTINRLSAILWETRFDNSSTQIIEGYRLYSLQYTFNISFLFNKFSQEKLKAINDTSFSGKFILAYNQEGSYAKTVLDAYGLKVSPQMTTIERCLRIYLVYKTFSVAEKYPSYSHFNDIGDVDNAFLTTKEPTLLKKTTELVEKIKKDESHITLKIRQTLYEIDAMSKLSEAGKKRLEIPFSYSVYCKLLGISEATSSIEERLNVLPPPFYKPDIFLVKSQLYDNDIVDNESRDSKLNRLKEHAIHVNQLSSGERQFVFMSTTLIYHAINLKSVPKQERIAYNNVCMVLDEIEICFHPEYQRTFINNLIELLKRTKLNKAFNINVLIVTHSPFVLSDIPKGNILYLKEGKNVTKEVELNTFGANVNELLAQSFFLAGGFMGEYAKNKIESLVDFLKYDKNKDVWDEPSARNLIDIVGDEVIQFQLRQLYARKYVDSDYYKSWIKREAIRLGITE